LAEGEEPETHILSALGTQIGEFHARVGIHVRFGCQCPLIDRHARLRRQDLRTSGQKLDDFRKLIAEDRVIAQRILNDLGVEPQ
jgi:hypothetical protein